MGTQQLYYSESGMYSDRKIWRSRSTHQAKYRETWLKTKLDLPISIADLFKIQRNKHTLRLLRQIVILLTDKSNVLMKSLAKVWQRFHQKLKDLSTEHNYRYSSLQPKFRDPSRQVRSQEWCFQQSSVQNRGFVNDFSLDVSKIGLILLKMDSCFNKKWRRLANLAIYRDLGESLETTRTDFGPKFNENRTVWSEFLLGVVFARRSFGRSQIRKSYKTTPKA